MKDADRDPGALQRHMAGTYFSLRLGIAVIGTALPVLLWLGGRFLDHASLRGSMSAYYYSHSMRNVFVGSLVTVGALLYLYKGFSREENWALNLAGVFAVGVALVATTEPGVRGPALTWHATFAVLFFVAIAYVCVFRASDTLSLVNDEKHRARLRRVYKALGAAMLVVPLGVVALTFLIWGGNESPMKFFLEAGAVWVFGAYWVAKSIELATTNAEQAALERKLLVKDAWRSGPGRVVRTDRNPASPAPPAENPPQHRPS
jgi:hypothetical protein